MIVGSGAVCAAAFFKSYRLSPPINPDSCKIITYEYWMDDDYTNNTFMYVAPTEGVFSLTGDLSLSGLTLGQHTFHIRFKDECGKWSSVLFRFF